MTGDLAEIVIRDERPGDELAIREVTIAAFSESDFGHHGEADLVDSLRCSPSTLSLVACTNERIVGHILFTPVVLRTEDGTLRGMGLAPMSVTPRWQGQGIGTSLVRHGIQRLESEDCHFVVVLGHADYYPRLGFVPAKQFNVEHGFEGIPQEVFFMQCLSRDKFEHVSGGLAYYQSEFGPQHTGR